MTCRSITEITEYSEFFRVPVYRITHAKINNMKRLLIESDVHTHSDKAIKNVMKKKARFTSNVIAARTEIKQLKKQTTSFIQSFFTLGRD